MKNNKKLVGDITKGYTLMDAEEAAKVELFCNTIGRYLGVDKTNYNDLKAFPIHNHPLDIANVIFNCPATIVYWKDGTKTVVKADKENFDPEKGLAMAISKKALGNKGNYFNKIKKWAQRYEEVPDNGKE